MRHALHIWILLLTFLTIDQLSATNDYRERVYVQTDKQVYLAGELLWFKLCLTDAEGIPASFSKVGYLELLNGESAVAQAKVDIKAGVGEGWLELPALLSSGYYRLVAYTRYMRNEGDTIFFRKTIGVVNTFRKDESISTTTASLSPTLPERSEETIRVSTDKTTYNRREAVEIRIQGLPTDVHTLSVSVAGKEFIPVPGNSTIHDWRSNLSALPQPKLTDTYLPEYEGHLIQGEIVNTQTGEPSTNKNVSPVLGFVGDKIRVFGGQTQANKSEVWFYTSGITGTHELATAVYANGEETYRLDIQSPFTTHPSFKLPTLQMDPAWEEELTRRNAGLQVTRSFTTDSMSQTLPSEPFFRWKPFKTYLFDEYTRFPTLGESVFEFVESVSFRKTKGKRTLFVLLSDLSNHFSINQPLVLFDGIPIKDHETLYTYNPALIKRLDVYRERYAFGGQVYEGIIAFYSHDNDYPALSIESSTQLFDYEGTEAHRLFYAPTYPDEISRKNRIPDYRHTLLWMPNVSTEGRMELSIPFYTSDLPGEYTVTVEGLTKDGKPLQATTTLRITE